MITAAKKPRVYRSRGVPAYPSVGRQPETLYIIPSKPQPWYGAIVAGDALTRQQRYAMERRGLPADAATITVRRLASDREYYWPNGTKQRPYFEFACPIDRRRKDGRIFVIAPSGDVKLVHADGWVF